MTRKTVKDWVNLRILPTEPFEKIIDKVSTSRYVFACQYVSGRVLDIACGAGYGTDFLSKSCRYVIAGDVDDSAVMFAVKKYSGNSKVCFMSCSAHSLPFAGSTFDAVVSLETIEHLNEVEGRRFVADIWRVLKDGGVLILSTPNRFEGQPGDNVLWRWHLREYNAQELRCLLKSKFKKVDLFGQMIPKVYAFDRANRKKLTYKAYALLPKKIRNIIYDIKNLILPSLYAYQGSPDGLEIFFSDESVEQSCNLLAVCWK